MPPSSSIKSPDKLNMTPQEAYNVLQQLLETQKLKMADLEVALGCVRNNNGKQQLQQQQVKKKGLFSGLRRTSSNVDSSSHHNESSEHSNASNNIVSAIMKQPRSRARQKVRAQHVDVSGSKDDSQTVSLPVYEKSQASVAFLTQALSSDSNFLFSSLSPNELHLLIGAMAPCSAKADTMIIQQGDIGDYFYVLEIGRVDFIVDGNLVGHCGSGASFGELALLYDAPRAATCKAHLDCQLWKVDQHTFRYMLAKTQANQNSHIHSILRKVPFLSELEDSALSKIIDALVTVKFHKNDEIFRKGQVGDKFYILEKGKARIHEIGFGDTKFDDVFIDSGAYFGERALLTGEPRAAHVTATTDCVCFTLSRESFEATLGPLQALMDRAMTKRVLVSIPSFGEKYIDNHELDRLLDSMKEVSFKKGEIIMEEGVGVKPALHIIRKGNVSVVSNKGEINNLTNGGHFGESTLIMKSTDSARATISALDEVVCNVLTKADIEKVIGSTTRLGQARALINLRERRDYVKYSNLTKVRILGVGTFGKVWLAVDKTTNRSFALKLMDKKQCIEHGQHEGVIREKNILANIDHPFLLKMWGSYQTDKHLMMLIDLIQGGELFTVLHTDKRDGVPNGDAVFYAACVLEGLGHLHERNIVYRDLKASTT
ncbi:hypothetical protein MPSEU_000669200 [Mayamaea pseudoterrestris]|nr:hypothetical protein MPSEU_000669200 [Mayamaea pseudoterrestris]